jgi:hypothetical protein
MPDASLLQASFLGGEWSPFAQGRVDHPQYRSAMSTCLNAMPVEEGACPRRPGFNFICTTRNGAVGRVLDFNVTDQAAFRVELTAGHLRMLCGSGGVWGLVYDSSASVVSVSLDNPAIVTVAGATTWQSEDQVQFLFQSGTVQSGAILRNRQFGISVLNASQVSLYDPATGDGVDGAAVNWDPATVATVGHILDLPTLYAEADLQKVRLVVAATPGVSATGLGLLLHNGYAPQTLALTLDATGPNFSAVTLTAQQFEDGPYLDAVPNSQMTPSGSGADYLALFTPWGNTYNDTPNWGNTAGQLVTWGGYNFVCIQSHGSLGADFNYWFSTFPTSSDYYTLVTATAPFSAYNADTAYVVGDVATYSSLTYVCIQNGTGEEPDTATTYWTSVVLASSGLGGTVSLQLSYLEWGSTTSYSIGSFVSYGGFAYQSLAAVNYGQEPDVSPSYWTAINDGGAVGPQGFTTANIGQLVRLLSQPAAWAAGTGYSAGETVTYNAAYYVAQASTTGNEPDTSLTDWLPTTSLSTASWFYAQIITVVNDNNIVVNMLDGDLLNSNPITTWQLGAYGGAVGYPGNGCYYEGRLWLGGALPNRLDSSNSNDFFNFAPTGPDGTVGDANSVSAIFNSNDQNAIYWVEPCSSGLVCGTKDGEWLVQASTLNDPITPTSIQVHRYTKIGDADVLPCHTPLTLVFVHKYGRMLFEYFPDVFSGRMTAPVLNSFSKHLTVGGVQEIAYQSEMAPVVWGRTGDGALIGWTYRRVSQFSTEEPKFVGAHRHTLGSGRLVESLCVGADASLTLDTLTIVSNDPATNIRHIEVMTPLMDPSDPVTSSWFVDDAVSPSGIQVTTQSGVAGVMLYGLWHLNGQTVSAVLGGFDCGDILVTNGAMFVPFGADPAGLVTQTTLQSFSTGTWGSLGTTMGIATYSGAAPTTEQDTIQMWTFPVRNFAGVDGSTLIVDWANNRAFAASQDNGFRTFSVTGAAETSEANFVNVGGDVVPQPLNSSQAWTYGLDGYIYAQYTGGYAKIDPGSWTTITTFGTDEDTYTPNAAFIPPSSSLATVRAGANYLVCGYSRGSDPVSCGITVIDTDTMAWVIGSAFTGTHAPTARVLSMVTVTQGSAGGLVISMDTPYGVITDQLTFYSTAITAAGAVTTQTIGNIPLASIDPQWVEVSATVGPFVDTTDNNLIVGVTNGAAGAVHPCYLMKVNTANASIIWKTAVAELPASFVGVQYSRVQSELYAYVGDTTVYIWNLGTGTFETAACNRDGNHADAQVSDATTGTIILYGGYTSETGRPAQAPGSPTSFTDHFATLTVGTFAPAAGSVVTTSSSTLPGVVGFTYTTQGQPVRPALPQEAGAANGPAQGKTRRSHMMNCLLAGAVYGTLFFGTVFTKLRGAYFKSAGGIPVPTTTLYSGVYWSTLEDDYSFEGAPCWQISRPLPAHVVSLGAFLNTQDR